MTPQTQSSDRVVVSTIKNGRVGFGQVVMEQRQAPKRVVLVAVDPDFGLYYWSCPHSKIKRHTVSQHAGYSRCLPPFAIDDEPSFLGEGWEVPAKEIANWSEILEANTRRKQKLLQELLA